MGRIPEALEQYEAARVVLQNLLDRYPPHILPRTRSELSNILINIAELQRMQGRLTEARANCDKAVTIREAVIKEFPEVVGYRVRMGECWLRSGQVKLAAGDIPGAAAEWRAPYRRTRTSSTAWASLRCSRPVAMRCFPELRE